MSSDNTKQPCEGKTRGWRACRRPATIEREGKHYCTAHDPRRQFTNPTRLDRQRWRMQLESERLRKEQAELALLHALARACVKWEQVHLATVSQALKEQRFHAMLDAISELKATGYKLPDAPGEEGRPDE